MLLSRYKPIHLSFNHLNKILHSTKDYYPSNPRKKRKRNLTTLIEQNPSTILKNKHSTGNLKHLSHSQRSRSKFNINTRSTHRKKPYPRYYSRLESRGPTSSSQQLPTTTQGKTKAPTLQNPPPSS